MLNFALKYLKQGLSVIPLEPKGKRPLISWTEFQSRHATEDEVKGWFAKTPMANIGIVTGSVSGVAIIDLDGPEGLVSSQNLGLKSSVVSLTGNGKHLWFRYPKEGLKNAVRIVSGMDLRGDGGYVVAPPSIHESERRYRWTSVLNAQSFLTLPLFPVEKFAETVLPIKKFEGKEEGWIAKALEEMKNGNIDSTLTSILGRMRADNWSADDALALLQPHAERVGAEDGHLDEKIKNVWERYEPNVKSATTSYVQEGLRPGDTGLVIHSPTNPDSIHGFEQSRVQVEGASDGLKTGYCKLDTMLHGGLKSSRLFTVAARTGVGKTNWLLGAARTLCVSGKKVLLFSTEMPYAQIWERYIQTLDNPKSFNSHQFFVCDSFAPNIERVEEAINEIKPDVFMFDHINHVSEEQRELGSFMQGLNYLRRKYDVAGIVTAQLNRSADWVDLKTGEKVTPRMSMIKGSGTIEQASSRVLLLSETRVTPEMTEIVGNLDKNDNGPKGLVHFGLMNSPYKMIEL
jgi:Bifunctional DNA primase/polymerase, N-terminal/DnaB-like helicase C terminal domain